MSKFFVDENNVNYKNNTISITGEDINHIKNVLRLSENDEIIISITSNNPKTYLSKIIFFEETKIECSIIKELVSNNEPNIKLSIFQGIPKFDKMELIIQKCTELGAVEFIPLELSRCIVKIHGKDIEKKTQRWQKIAEVAAKQSGRDIIPSVKNKIELKEFCKIIKDYDLTIVAYEDETETSIKDILRLHNEYQKIAIVIGPEGGFEKEEIAMLEQSGAKIVSLGNRILRTETVGIVLSSILMFEFNELNLKG